MTRRFTGRHMLALMLAFFGTVVAINVAMATLATRTFGGTVVDNSYVASQKYNDWLAEARAQRGLGWSVAAERDESGHVEVRTIAGAHVSALAQHPVGRSPDVALAFVSAGDGRYRSTAPLPAGRWNLRLAVERGGERLRLIEALR